MKKLLCLLLIFTSLVGFAQNSALFDQGKELYKNGKYQQAVDSWMKVIDKGEHSTALYFNLGNAQYKLNNIGPSIYYYEKALLLSPDNEEVKNNLAFAENARIDEIEPLPKTVFAKWYNSVAGVFTYNGWAILAVIFSILFVLLFLLYYFSAYEKRKRILFASSLLSILLFIGAITFAYFNYGDAKKNMPAIIFSEKTEIKSEPNMGSASAFTLHEGTKVQITAKDGNWYRIVLADGKDGWIPGTDLKQL